MTQTIPETQREPASRPRSAPGGAPGLPLLTAARRHWLLVLVPVIIFTGAAIAFASLRDPVYRAETRVATGLINVTTPGAVAGFSTSSEALASTYSRAIDSDAVVEPVAKDLGLSITQVRRRLTSSPFPESPVLRVQATGPSAASAKRLADSGAQSLIAYVVSLSTGTGADDAREAMQRAARSVAVARQTVADRAREYGDSRTATNRRRLVAARGVVVSREAVFDSRRTAYERRLEQADQRPVPQVIQNAATARSDKASKLQLLGFGGFIAGLALGLVLATWWASRLMRRAYR